MTDRRSHHLLASTGFLTGLLLLLVNDLVLKEQFHNELTGKLSDFAGLFVFPLFWTALIPRRKRFIYLATAVLFVFWKSGYAQFLIEGWNSLPLFSIQRTVDYTDLLALLILPLSYSYSNTTHAGVYVSRRLIYPIAIVSLFAFTATSYSHKESFNNQYAFQTSKKDLRERISRLPRNNVLDRFWNADKFDISFDSCNGRAVVSLEERERHSILTLTEMEHRCPGKPDKDAMRQYFEKEFIDKLREEPVHKSDHVLDVYSR